MDSKGSSLLTLTCCITIVGSFCLCRMQPFRARLAEYNLKLKEIALSFVGVANEKRATLFRNLGEDIKPVFGGRPGGIAFMRSLYSCRNC